MSRISYESVETLVFDPVAANRAATRSCLLALGFRKVETVATVEALSGHLTRRPPDLAICEIAGVEEPLCRAIQSLRQGLSAYNPFLVVIVTAWENHNSLVSRVVNSGADDLILRPFSTTNLEQRIRSHVERRKGFVITSDYVGPDRRRNDDRPSNAELFLPPNSLRMKAKDRITEDQAVELLDVELKRARTLLTTEKLRREAFQICVLWRLTQTSTRNEDYGTNLLRLAEVTRVLARRARDTEYEAAVAWCDAIGGAIEGLELGVDRNASMHLLGHAAISLNQVFVPDKSSDETLNEIDATVGMIRARDRAAAEEAAAEEATAASAPRTDAA